MEKVKLSYTELFAAAQHCKFLLTSINDELNLLDKEYENESDKDKEKKLEKEINELEGLYDEVEFYLKEINTTFLEQVQRIKFQIDTNYEL